jgi:hypothetical protein
MDGRGFVTAAALAVALVCAGAGIRVSRASRGASRIDNGHAGPIAEMLKENATIARELQAAPYAEGENSASTAS